MRTLFLLLCSFLFTHLLAAQNFPSDAQVLQDVKNYHGKIATAKVQNEWKLEREAGYTFSNMAKRVVAATTVKENGASKNIIGLAIYTRGGAGEGWTFSRYFVTSSETVGLAEPDEAQLKNQLLDLLRKDPMKVSFNYKDIAWVYDVRFPEGIGYTTDRTGDRIYKAEIEYASKFIAYYPFEGGIRRYKNPLEVYVRAVDGALKVAVAIVNNQDPVETTLMTEKQFNDLPTLEQKPLDDLFGPQGPEIPAAEPEKKTKPTPVAENKAATPTPATENKNTTPATPNPAPQKTIKLPKVKLGIKGL